jgi:DNA repair protein RecO (recombination protein O)
VSTYRDEAIVLGSHKFGEADRVVVLFTRSYGKVRAVAKGIRRTKSSIGARLEPLSHVDVSCRVGRELDTIAEVRLVHTHTLLRTDFDRLSQGLSMVEAINKISLDREPVPEMFDMLSRALHALNDEFSPLMVGAFYLKLMAMDGSAPQVHECVRCGEDGELIAFDSLEGGALCRGCRSGVSISPHAISLMQKVLDGRLKEALAEPDSPPVHEVNLIAMRVMEAHLERRIKSLGVFDRHL